MKGYDQRTVERFFLNVRISTGDAMESRYAAWFNSFHLLGLSTGSRERSLIYHTCPQLPSVTGG